MMDDQAIALNMGVVILAVGFMLGEVASNPTFRQSTTIFAVIGTALVAASLLGVKLSMSEFRQEPELGEREQIAICRPRGRDF